VRAALGRDQLLVVGNGRDASGEYAELTLQVCVRLNALLVVMRHWGYQRQLTLL
jgi:hypothetical protein